MRPLRGMRSRPLPPRWSTAIMHLLLLTTPRPQMFFASIIGLVTVIAVVYPFSTTAPLSQKVATAVNNLVLGAAIGSLINGTAARVIRRRAVTGGYYPTTRRRRWRTELPEWDPSPHATSVPEQAETAVTNGHPRAARTASDPQGGGSYIVAGEELGRLPGLMAAAGLLID
jgi:hypothetical protein